MGGQSEVYGSERKNAEDTTFVSNAQEIPADFFAPESLADVKANGGWSRHASAQNKDGKVRPDLSTAMGTGGGRSSGPRQ